MVRPSMTVFALADAAGADGVVFAAALAVALGVVTRGVPMPIGRVPTCGAAVAVAEGIALAVSTGVALAVSVGAALAVVVALGAVFVAGVLAVAVATSPVFVSVAGGSPFRSARTAMIATTAIPAMPP